MKTNLIILGFLMFAQSGLSQSMKLPYDIEVEQERVLLVLNKIEKRIKLRVKEQEKDTVEISFYNKEGVKASVLERNTWLSSVSSPPDDFPKWKEKKLVYNDENDLIEIIYQDGTCQKINYQRSPLYSYFEEFDEEHMIYTTGYQDSLGQIKGKKVYVLNEDYQVSELGLYNQVQSESWSYKYNKQKQKVKLIINNFRAIKPIITTYDYYDNGLLKSEQRVWYRRDQQMNTDYEYVYE